jgi:hypothetical protein
MLAIAMATSKTFLLEHLLNEDGSPQCDKLRQVMDKFLTLSSPNVQNLISSFKHQLGNRRNISSILTLKAKNGYYYIQDGFFLGQLIGKKVFLFKMFMHGNGSGCDLVK